MIIRINGKELSPNITTIASVEDVDNTLKIFEKVRLNSYTLFSAGGSSLLPLIDGYMDLSKFLTVAVIMFAGTAWMFGHRTKAIELLIGAAAGFLIILNAWDMVEYLESLKR